VASLGSLQSDVDVREWRIGLIEGIGFDIVESRKRSLNMASAWSVGDPDRENISGQDPFPDIAPQTH